MMRSQKRAFIAGPTSFASRLGKSQSELEPPYLTYLRMACVAGEIAIANNCLGKPGNNVVA